MSLKDMKLHIDYAETTIKYRKNLLLKYIEKHR